MPVESAAATELVLIGLGANLGDPLAQLQGALRQLELIPGCRMLRCSPIYRTAPWGDLDQADFLNAVAAFAVACSPRALLKQLLALELSMGRVRTGRRYGPRTLDLDILSFGERRLDATALTLPHPRISERAFVLVPLLDLASTFKQLPAAQWREHLSKLAHADVVRLHAPDLLPTLDA
ncbi:MAG: 2-amino-4-hydroxy-6-hydroxymethyldihydropteridine diphosphokinase [Lysobacterales bacterium CG_4_9_14_3_um_filter_62_6]|nr:MAG: 2-amino-4-hydroxy-6-hydroxymethyldihydropteridine diphosphokinase [Xanthomonadales bacterium CG_4_9_14_3_um_filter_62_6]